MEVTNEDEDEGLEERDWWVRALEAMKLPVIERSEATAQLFLYILLGRK